MNRSELLAQVKERKGLALVDTRGHYNFIDTNNRLFGFDMYDQCCEDFDCKIEWCDEKEAKPEQFETDEGAVSFYEGVFFAGTIEGDVEGSDYSGGEGGEVKCPLHNDARELVGYIVAHNWHNGYYYHGVEHNLTDDGRTVEISL